MNTEVQKVPLKGNLKLTIYYHLKQGLQPKGICQKYNLKYSAISYYLKDLKQNGYIKKVAYGTWITTSKELQIVPRGGGENLNFFQDKIRGHAYQFTLKIPTIKKWKYRTKFLKKAKIEYELVGFGKSIPSIQLTYYKTKYKVWLCKQSIVLYFPKSASFFKRSAEAAKREAVYRFLQVIRKLETTLNTSFKIKKKYQFKIFNQHYALINNEIAKHYHRENKKLQVRGKDGKVWLLVDNSFNLHELEGVHSTRSQTDIDEGVVPFFNKVRDNWRILDELEEGIKLARIENASRVRDVFEDMNQTSVVLEALKNRVMAIERRLE